MLAISATNIIIWAILIGIIILCTIGIVIASIFQSRKNKKYKNLIDKIKEDSNLRFEIKDGLSKDDINKIDSEVDVDKLMQTLYETYLSFIDKINNNNDNFDNLLDNPAKTFYIRRLDNFKLNGYRQEIKNIDLIGYSIVEYSKNILKFRINVNCLDYKLQNNNIVSGSNLIKLEQVIILTFEKKDQNWLIINYDKIYERKLSN